MSRVWLSAFFCGVSSTVLLYHAVGSLDRGVDWPIVVVNVFAIYLNGTNCAEAIAEIQNESRRSRVGC